jgi:hypothetical protein
VSCTTGGVDCRAAEQLIAADAQRVLGTEKELFYLSQDRKLMAVDVKGDGRTFDAGVPKELFELRLQTVGLPGPRNFYVAAEDGKRFLVNSAAVERISTPDSFVRKLPSLQIRNHPLNLLNML